MKTDRTLADIFDRLEKVYGPKGLDFCHCEDVNRTAVLEDWGYICDRCGGVWKELDREPLEADPDVMTVCEQLQGLVEILPRTADGILIVPDIKVWMVRTMDGGKTWRAVQQTVIAVGCQGTVRLLGMPAVWISTKMGRNQLYYFEAAAMEEAQLRAQGTSKE